MIGYRVAYLLVALLAAREASGQAISGCFTARDCQGSPFTSTTYSRCCLQPPGGQSFVGASGQCHNCDDLVIEFSRANHTVGEGSSFVTLEILKFGESRSDVQFSVVLEGRTAASGSDFGLFPTPFVELTALLLSNETQLQFGVQIMEDSIVEDTESFVARLQLPSEPNLNPAELQIGLGITSVNIIDNDFVNVTVTPSNITVAEELQQLSFQVTKEGIAVRDVQVVIFTQSRSARAPGDFLPLQRDLTFSPSDSELSATVTVQDDVIVENEEEFLIVVAAAPEERGVMTPRNTLVATIADDDTLEVGFSSSSFTVRESRGSASVVVVKVGENERPVSVLFSTQNGTATDADDFVSVTGRVLTFGPSDTVLSVPVSILQEGLLEDVESFSCILSTAPGESGVVISQGRASVDIIDSDEVTIGFEVAAVEVIESAAMVEIAVSLQSGTLGRNATVAVSDLEGRATASSDFQLITTTTLVFSPSVLRQNVTLRIIDDSLYEGREDFSLVLTTSDSGINPSPSQAIFTIIDNDIVNIMFDEDIYMVRENAQAVSVTLTLGGQLQSSLVVAMVTQDISAIGGDDYEVTSRVLTFDQSTRQQGASVAIIDDEIGDGIKEFSLLVLPEDSELPSPLAEATVQIIDNENVTVAFSQSSYSVNEGDPFALLVITKSGVTQQEININVVLQQQTAQGGFDFGPFPAPVIVLTVVLLGNETRLKYGVVILEDSRVEEAEQFIARLELQEGTIGIVLGERSEAVVVIEDNDFVNITLSPENITVIEDSTAVNFIISRDSNTILDRIVRVDFATVGDTAAPGRDFESRVLPLMFTPSGPTTLPASVAILEDEVVEAAERLLAVLSVPPGEGGVALVQNVSTVVIRDDDEVMLEFSQPSYTVVEGEGVVSVTVVLVGSGEKERVVAVELSTTDSNATASSDYNATLQLVEIAPGQRQQTVAIAILNDTILEGLETFLVQLRVPPNEGGVVLGSLRSSAIVIVDDDRVTVDFERPVYTVREGDVVTLVVRMVGGSDINVMVVATTESGTAVAPSDFTAVTQVLVFPPSESNQTLTLSVPTSNDMVHEGREEIFSVRLEVPMGEDGVALGAQDTVTVTILDSDTLQVGFEREDYSAREGEMVEVCVVKTGRSESTVDVLVAPVELSVPQTQRATSSLDFSAVPIALSLRPTEERGCVNISILADMVDEEEEKFSVEILSVSAGIGISRQSTNVTIQPGPPPPAETVVSFEEEEYSVGEGDGTAVVCVVWTGNPPTEDIVVQVETTPCIDSATSIFICTRQNLTLTADIDRDCISITLLDNTAISLGEQTIRVMFSLLSGIATVLQSMATIVVADDEGLLGNDTIVGDPLFAVPLYTTNASQLFPGGQLPHLCYEIHGSNRSYFNLVSDTCVSVNAYYITPNRTLDINVISMVGIRAVNRNGLCVNIEVGIQNGCMPVISEPGRPTVSLNRYRSGGISVSKYRERVRVSVPNCENVQLVMWVTCQERLGVQMVHFVITRGVNLRPTSHGLLGQFWNIPVTFEMFVPTGPPDPYFSEEVLFTITIHPVGPGSTKRRFVAEFYEQTWDFSREVCFYAGNIQGGPVLEIDDPNDSVIQGSYKDYSVRSLFANDFVYSQFNASMCV